MLGFVSSSLFSEKRAKAEANTTKLGLHYVRVEYNSPFNMQTFLAGFDS